jgi:hypothetical protein
MPEGGWLTLNNLGQSVLKRVDVKQLAIAKNDA